MALVLRVLVAGGCSVVEDETRICDGASFTIGRGAENDWVVADPQRHLSKQHCRIERRGRGYAVVDTSTNGVFVAGSATPLGRGNAHPVNDGDVISLGPCTLRLEMNETPAAGVPEEPRPFTPTRPAGAAIDPALPISHILSGNAALELPLSAIVTDDGEQAQPTAFAPPDPVAAVPSTAAHFRPPEIARPTIPTDWQAGEADAVAAIEDAVPVRAVAADRGTVRAFPMPETAPPARPPAAQQQVVGAASLPRAADDLLAAFLDGAGLPADAIDAGDAAATMQLVGQAFREAVGGLRELLELRAFLKSEFRIEHTLLRAKENNPLKFSANVDGTLSVLLGRRVPGFMAAPEAIRESVRDIKTHEVALIASMKAVIGDVLEQLSPETVRSAVSNSVLPQVHKARCWERYEQVHQVLAGDQTSGPPLGSQFSKAYTRQIKNV